MKRRDWLHILGATTLSVSLPSGLQAATEFKKIKKGSFSLDGNRLRFYHPEIHQPFQTVVVADTHLFRDDERGIPFKPYSGRMAKAYNQTKHYLTGEPTNPEKSFIEALQFATEKNASSVVLLGDIVSFPSEAAIDFVLEQTKSAGLPFTYTAGNHDWHYEGMEGSIFDLRNEWIRKRLQPLYGNNHPLMQVQEQNGVRIVVLDNSNYQITPEQLKFFKQQINTGKPVVLMVHIPLYAPGRSVGYGCGHPKWGAKADENYELERRERWPEAGHNSTTMEFHRTVFNAPNLLGVVAGHIHRPSLDIINGIPQIVTEANARGACLEIEFIPTT